MIRLGGGAGLEREDLVIGGIGGTAGGGVSALRMGLGILGHRAQTAPRLLVVVMPGPATAEVLQDPTRLGLMVAQCGRTLLGA
ncbi:hypothetical protein IOD13_08540 [Brevibacterium casei]|nr:hypothetical protein [Brevibacterium casei]